MHDKSSGNSLSQLDVNSCLFNSEEFLGILMKDGSLSELSEVHQSTTKRLRELEIKMQNLVYDNYNKFVSATNAVKNMKIDLEEMEPEIQEMASNVELITETTSEIKISLNSGRKQLLTCYNYQTSLKRLQVLLNLPEKLKKFAETKNFASAAEFFTKTRKFYSEFSSNQNLASAADKSAAVMTEIIQSLKDILKCGINDISKEELSEAAELLIKLGHDLSKVVGEFLIGCETNMTDELNKLEEMSKHSRYFENLMNSDCLTFIHNLSLVSDAFMRIFEGHLKNDNFVLVFDEIVSLNGRMCDRLFSIINEGFDSEIDDSQGTTLLFPILRRLTCLNYIMPIHFKLDIEYLFLKVFRSRISLHFENLKNRMQCLYDKAIRDISTDGDILKAVEVLQTELFNGLKESLQSLNRFFDSVEISLSSVHIHTEIVDNFVFASIKTAAKQKFRLSVLENTDGSVLLLKATFCSCLADHVVPDIISYIRKLFSLSLPSNYSSFIYDLKVETTFILGDYGKFFGGLFSQKQFYSIDYECTWVNGVSKAMMEICGRYQGLFDLLRSLYPQFEQNMTRSEYSIHSAAHNSVDLKWRSDGFLNSKDSTTLLKKNIEKLFAERIEIFTPVEACQRSILNGITKVHLKNFVEYIRRCTLSEVVVRQIQLDLHYLSELSYVSSNEVFMLLDEVMASSMTRCAGKCELLDFKTINEIVCKSK